MRIPLKCVDCGSEFIAGRRDAMRCESCARARRSEQVLASYHARQAAKHSEPKTTACVECGKIVPALRSTKKYCDTCYKIKQRRHTRLAQAKRRKLLAATRPVAEAPFDLADLKDVLQAALSLREALEKALAALNGVMK